MLNSDGRDYRITEMLMNGQAVLDAQDTILAHHRRVVTVLELPAGSVAGATLRCYDDGRIELVAELALSVVCDLGASDVVRDAIQLSPNLGAIIHATVVTVAREYDLALHIAAHIIRTWIKVEYLM